MSTHEDGYRIYKESFCGPTIKLGIQIIGLKQGYKRPTSIPRTSVDMSAP